MKNFLIVTCAYIFIIINQSFAQSFNKDYVDGVIYFKVKSGSNIIIPEFNSINKNQVFELLLLDDGMQISEIKKAFKTKDSRLENIYRIDFENYPMINEILRRLNSLSYIEYAEKSPLYKLLYTPSDPNLDQQYYLEKINAYAAFDLLHGDYKTKLAIVDDALRTTHPDLADNIYVNPNEIIDGIDNDSNGFIDDINGWDVADNDNNTNPPASPPLIWGELAYTHGTHCAGLAGAVTDNNYGIAAASFNHIEIMGVKCVKNSSWFPISIAYGPEGVDYAVSSGAEVVSMSFGGPQQGFETLETLIQVGQENGIIFVAAAGNDGNENPTYPAAYPGVIAVGATDQDDKLASFSQRGDFITVVAPGAGIYSSLAWSQEFGPQDGTSMACPLVAGVVALLKSQFPEASSEQIINCLTQGCDNIDELNPNFIGKMGAGRINIYNSLICLEQTTKIQKYSSQNFSVYPNPAYDEIFVSLNGNKIDNLTIKDITGKFIKYIKLNEKNQVVNISDIPSGFYIIECLNNGKIYSQKLLKY